MENSNFIIKTVKYSNNRGFKIIAFSKSKKIIFDFQKIFSDKNWKMIKDKTLLMQKHIENIENPITEREQSNSFKSEINWQ